MSPLSSQSGRHLLDGTARVFLAGLLFPLTGLITAAFLTRRLGADGYGLLVLATTIFGWLEFSINSFFSRATIKFVGETKDWRSVAATVIRLHVLAGIGGGLLLVLLSFPVASLLHEPLLTPYLALYALHLPISSLSQGHQNILIGMGHFRQKAMSNAGRWLARLVLILMLVGAGLSVSGAILGSLGAALVELAIARQYIKPPFLGRITMSIRPFYDLGWVLGLASLFLLIFFSLGLIMLRTLGGTIQQVGLYGAAQNLAILPGLFGTAFSPLLLSTISRLLAEKKIGEAKDMIQGAMRIALGLFPFGALMAGAAPEIVTWVFGESFEPAAPILALLMIGAIAFVMVSIGAVIAAASGAPSFALYVGVSLMLSAAIGNYLLIPPFGAFGAALATAVCQIIGAMVSVGMIYRLWSIVPPSGTMWRSLASSALAYSLAVAWPVGGSWLLVKMLGISAIILLIYKTLGEFSHDELSHIRSSCRAVGTLSRNVRTVGDPVPPRSQGRWLVP
ncbi:MAG TPA: oligosaccharide flippase family protein [Nitrospira sp.]|nr:oligosaccharide flippase family protein [Nitrospira sp.]